MSKSTLALYRRITRWPAGQWIFARVVCFKAPYFATVAPRFITLEPGRCHDLVAQWIEAEQSGVVSASRAQLLKSVRESVHDFISVDGFAYKKLR